MLLAIDTSVIVAGALVGHAFHATERCASRGLKSGVIYDALHLVEAERTGADVFLTFNPSDFERLAAGSKPRIVVPPAPPSTQLPP